MKGKWIVIACVVFIGIGLFGTLIHAGSAWAQTKKGVLKIGVCGPLSGAGITYGYAALAGLELKNEEIQKAGGLKVGDTVYSVQPIPYDTKYLPDPSVTAVKRLVYEDKVKIIFGECGSAAAMAAQPITESNKIIYTINTYTNRTLSPTTLYTFRTGNTPMEFGPAMLAYYRQQFPQAKKIGYLYREDETGKSMLAMQQKNAPVQGFEVVPLPVEPGTMDLTPLVTKMISLNTDFRRAHVI
jgi:branched-chain amino acid transport system substrate-binding protein